MNQKFSLLLLSLVLLFGASTLAQSSIEISHADYTVLGTVDVPQHAEATLKNVSGSTISVKVKRESQTLATGHQSQICIGTTCYPPSVGEPGGSISIASGASDTTFYLSCLHGGNPGITTVTMSFFNEANVSDSVQGIFVFNLSGVGLEEEVLYSSQVGISHLYPNPAIDQSTFAYSTGSTGHGVITITDQSGRLISKFDVSGKTGTHDLNLQEYESGIYFISIIAGNESATKKLIVQ